MHREIIARELQAQLGDRYPDFIRPLSEGFEKEAEAALEVIDTKFDEMRQHVLNKVKNKREAKRYMVKELERAQLRKNESNLIQAFRSFFNRAAMQKEEDTKPEYDSFE